MGLINFIKNQLVSYEDDIIQKEVEVPVETKTKDLNEVNLNSPTKLPTILRDELFNETVKTEVMEDDIFDNKTKFTFPVEENDMVTKKEEITRTNHVVVDEYNIPINTLAGNNYYETERKFKPSQVISPIYGILDKNYRQEDITVKDERLYAVPRKKNLTYDDVRKKAFGTLTDEIELNLYDKSDEIKKTISNIDELLNNMNKRYEEKTPIENEETASLDFKDEIKINNQFDQELEELLASEEQNLQSDFTQEKSIVEFSEPFDDNFTFEEEIEISDTKQDNESVVEDSNFNSIEIVKIIDHNSNNIENIVHDNKEDSIEEVNKTLEEEDLFSLIDSMYEKGE